MSLFFFNDTATTEIYTLSLHDALPIYLRTDVRNRTAVPPAIHVFHTEAVARANANTGGAVLRTQCSEHLYHLAVDFRRDETLAVGVEAGGRPHLILDAALECECGGRREP